MPRLTLPPLERVPGGAFVAGLSRRVRTLIIALVVFVVLFVLALTMPVPYAVLSPGPTFDTLGSDPYSASNQPVIIIDGKTPNKTAGHLNMTTVSESTSKVTAFGALEAWLQGDRLVLPKTAIIPPGTSEQQQNQQNTQDFQTSQDSATVAALCELGYPKAFGVVGLTANAPAQGVLKVGDQLVSVDGKPTASYNALSAVLSATAPGTTVSVAVVRNGKPQTVQVKLGPAPSGGKGGRLGVSVNDTCLAPFTVTINLQDVGGPSAGLMFALGIIDKVGPYDLTKGQYIAGTGELDPSDPAKGTVEPIGGIALKMIAARNAGATVFLAPAGNCDTVRSATPSGLKVVKVSTVSDAVQDLLKLQRNEPVPSC